MPINKASLASSMQTHPELWAETYLQLQNEYEKLQRKTEGLMKKYNVTGRAKPPPQFNPNQLLTKKW